jgi:hypothetical protein
LGRSSETGPVIRISKGHFEPGEYAEVKRLIEESESTLEPAVRKLRGLIYYHAGIDIETNTVVNMSVWADLAAAKQMENLAQMLAQRPILERAGVRFDRIANYERLWSIGSIGTNA